MATAPLKILLADNNAEYRHTLACQLRSQSDFEVVGEVTSGEEAVQRARATTPDAILLDIEMPEMDAALWIRALKQAAPKADIIALSIVTSGRYQEECRRAGGRLDLPKDSPVETIFAALRSTRTTVEPAPAPL